MLKRTHEDHAAHGARLRELSQDLAPDWGSDVFEQVESLARSHMSLLREKSELNDHERAWRDAAEALALTAEELIEFLRLNRVHTLRSSLTQPMLQGSVQHNIETFSSLLAHLEIYSGAHFQPSPE